MKRFIAATLAALLIGSAGVAPATAQSGGFGIFFGDERTDFFPERITCFSDHQVRQAVAERGFTNIYLNVMMDKHVEVRATYEGWVYLLDFNYCTGRIQEARQLRPAR